MSDSPSKPSRRRLGGVMGVYALTVVINYVAQIPYALDLYGLRFSIAGAALLGATLVWFAVGLTLYAQGSRLGLVLITGYVVAQITFYTATDVLAILVGGGFTYQLLHARDPVVWFAFVAGFVNYLAAIVCLAGPLRTAIRGGSIVPG